LEWRDQTVADKVLFENPWATVLERDGWVVVRDVKGVGVALLPFRFQGGRIWYLSRLEPCPAHGELMHQTSITGIPEEWESSVQCAARELKEETGYGVDESLLIPLGKVWVSKLLEFAMFMFAVNVTDLTPTSPKGDGSKFEAMSQNVWVDGKQALQVPDAVWGSMLYRLAARMSPHTP
jgi:hypothetical protein